MADVQTPVMDIEEEVEVPQEDAVVEDPVVEEKPKAHVSTAAAEVSGKDAVDASKVWGRKVPKYCVQICVLLNLVFC